MQEEKKPLYTSLAAGALVLIVAFVVIGRWGGRTEVVNDPAPGTNAAPAATSTAGAAVPLEVLTRSSSTDIYAVRVEYPRFVSAPLLTAAIDRYVEDAIASFRANAENNDRARRETASAGEEPTDFQYSLDIAWDPAQINERFVSVALRLYAFDGGASGRQEVRTFNWDMQRQQAVTLSTLFPDDPDYLERVSAYTRQVLASTLGSGTSDSFLEDGTKPTLASFQFFTFTDDAVTFIFPKYQVAPGAAGEQEVSMPRNVTGLF